MKAALVLGTVALGLCLTAACQAGTPTATGAMIPTASEAVMFTATPADPGIEIVIESAPTVESAPTESSTVEVLPTGQPVVDASSTAEVTPSATNWMSRWPTATPTTVPTLALQPGKTTILKPGLYSRVSSPMKLEARLKPGDDGNVYIDLVGEDGRSLYSRFFDYSANRSADLFILHDIPFTVNGAAETGRLSISLKDSFGRVMSMSTVEIVLVSMGYDNVYAVTNMAEHYLVSSPYEDQFISGGMLEIYGVAYPYNSSPLIAELVDEQNNVIASGEVQLTVPSGGENYADFTLQVPFSVTRTTFARLILKQMSDDRIPGVVCLSSMRVILKP